MRPPFDAESTRARPGILREGYYLTHLILCKLALMEDDQDLRALAGLLAMSVWQCGMLVLVGFWCSLLFGWVPHVPKAIGALAVLLAAAANYWALWRRGQWLEYRQVFERYSSGARRIRVSAVTALLLLSVVVWAASFWAFATRPDHSDRATRSSCRSGATTSSGSLLHVVEPLVYRPAANRSMRASPNACRAASWLWKRHSTRRLAVVGRPPRASGTT